MILRIKKVSSIILFAGSFGDAKKRGKNVVYRRITLSVAF